ncbi:MAG: protein-L-isoaspartate(D-aspartate) O-methyltransferase [Pirellulaceae bacterium]
MSSALLCCTRWHYCAVVLVSCAALVPHASGQGLHAWTEARNRMVREEVAGAGIKDPRVIEALRHVPRHMFVSTQQRNLAYFDMALPIGNGQTISPPFVVAFMTQVLIPQPTDKVLEIGTGSGYQAAVLGEIVAEVYSIEIVGALGRKAAQTLRRQGYDNVHTRVGDGFKGWPEHAPFDKIIVTCSPERIPPALIAQLREGGRMVIPLGERYQQALYLLRKVKGRLEPEMLEPTFFVPMTGRAEDLRRVKDDSGVPRLVNADFEFTDDQDQLLGWYYVRQAEVAKEDAPHGKRFLRLQNDTPGRGAQALQAVGIDGRQVRQLGISVSVKVDNVRAGQSPRQLPQIELSFFDERRAPVGTQVLGPWVRSMDWTDKQKRISVPPRARLGVLAVGMLGATGEFSIDDLKLVVIGD